MDVFELAATGNAEALEAALLADPALAASRHASGASLLAWSHYVGQPQLAELVQRTAGELDAYEAIISGDLPRLRALIEAGWDPNLRSPDGFPPLALAAFFVRNKIFDLLLPLTTNVDAAATNAQKVAAIHAAAARQQSSMIEKLLRAGADPDLRQAGGFTPLHAAAQHGDATSAALLLLWGADRAARTDDGKDAAALAETAGHGWLAERLGVPQIRDELRQ